jgi:hypothetical protein
MVVFAAIFVNVGSNYFLVRYFQDQFGNGGMGFPMATDLTEVFVILCAVWLLPKAIFTRKLSTITFKTLAVGMAVSSAIGVTALVYIPSVIQVAVGVVVYAVLLLVQAVFDKNELDIILKGFSPNTLGGYLFSRRGVQL